MTSPPFPNSPSSASPTPSPSAPSTSRCSRAAMCGRVAPRTQERGGGSGAGVDEGFDHLADGFGGFGERAVDDLVVLVSGDVHHEGAHGDEVGVEHEVGVDDVAR